MSWPFGLLSIHMHSILFSATQNMMMDRAVCIIWACCVQPWWLPFTTDHVCADMEQMREDSEQMKRVAMSACMEASELVERVKLRARQD